MRVSAICQREALAKEAEAGYVSLPETFRTYCTVSRSRYTQTEEPGQGG